MKKSELSGKTVAELRELAKTSGLTGYSSLKKSELVDALAASTKSPKAAGKTRGTARRSAVKKTAKVAKAARKKPAAGRKADVEVQTGRGLAPRTRRAFSTYRTLGEQRIKASKYYLGVHEAPDIDDGFTFPVTHGEDIAVLMVRDPYWLFAYWEFSPGLNDDLIARLGEDTVRDSRLVLRVYDITGTDADNPVGYHDIDVAPGARDWYINVTHVESDYCVDIGLILPDGSFVVIARSNRVSLPPIGPSKEVDERWVTIESLREVYSLDERGPTSGSGGWGSGGWGQG
ncbi:MAG TPA: DUF4912 domain-containing protein [bacterium]|nr:DUF4912 domain-containing protein [bacterium]